MLGGGAVLGGGGGGGSVTDVRSYRTDATSRLLSTGASSPFIVLAVAPSAAEQLFGGPGGGGPGGGAPGGGAPGISGGGGASGEGARLPGRMDLGR